MEEQKKRGRKPGSHHSEETKAKMKAAWARRRCAATVSKPEDFHCAVDFAEEACNDDCCIKD